MSVFKCPLCLGVLVGDSFSNPNVFLCSTFW